MKFFNKPVPLWSHFAVLGVVALVVGALVAGVAAGLLTPPWLTSALGPQTEVKNEQVVTSIERLEQTDLIELSVQGISSAKGIPPAIVKDLPVLQNARIMQYSMKVQLGVAGVDITSTADHKFLVVVPAFKWTGSDDLKIERVFNDDEILSVFTSLPSETEQLNKIVDDELKQQYLEQNRQLLRDQAEFYFTKLAKSIDPDAKLTFEFAQ